MFVLLDHPLFLSYVTIPLICSCKMPIKTIMKRWPFFVNMQVVMLQLHLHYTPPCASFFLSGFFSRKFTIHRTAGKGEGYLFNSSLLLLPASRTRTRNLWFQSASVSFHLYVIEAVQNWWHLRKKFSFVLIVQSVQNK